ncbi:hypothetical protein F511_11089 [Dorcoceras hygrometricum]|uniref:Uncharacterized protein n=1 Tax=Dorcoceras hygrometricum TaxID=472368 RepID=A0A2Z7AGI1_9LAMI|nr:hypothetical protein F511_11089 [Dorcoceras hygrometricum]
MIVLDLSDTTHMSAGHHSDDSVGPFRHDTSVCRSERGSISESQSTDIMPQNTDTLMLKAVSKSSTHISILKFYPNRSYSGTKTSVCSIGFLAGLNKYSRNYLKSPEEPNKALIRSLKKLRMNRHFALLLSRRIRLPNWYQSIGLSTTSTAPPVLLQTTTEINGNLPEKCSNEQFLVLTRFLFALDLDSSFKADPDFSSDLNSSSIHSRIQISYLRHLTAAQLSMTSRNLKSSILLSSTKLSMTSRSLKSSILLSSVYVANPAVNVSDKHSSVQISLVVFPANICTLSRNIRNTITSFV